MENIAGESFFFELEEDECNMAWVDGLDKDALLGHIDINIFD